MDSGFAVTRERKNDVSMKYLILSSILFVALNAIPASIAAQNNLPPEVRERARKVMMPVVYKVPGMDKVKVVQNLKYTKTDDPNILMDLYLLADLVQTEKRPAVIFIHGGAKTEYTPKDWGIYTTWGTPDRRLRICWRHFHASPGISE